MSVPAAEAERRTTSVELLWDLVFVFAVTQVSTLLADDLSWTGLGRAMLVLALVWWAWSAFVWVTNAHDPDGPQVRGVLFAAMLLAFVVALAVPGAFGDDALLFVLAYSGVRFLHLGLYVDAARRGRASLAAIAGFAGTVAIGMALLIVGSQTGDRTRAVLWIAAAAIDYAGPAWLTRKRLAALQRVAVAHFAERYGLFIIICLGESIVATGLGAAGHRLDGAAEETLRTREQPVLAAADGYSYMHLLLVAGIIVFAVGAKKTVSHVADPLSVAERLALCGGVALYLAGLVAFGMRMMGTPSVEQGIAAAACLAVFAVAGDLPAWAVAGMVAAVLALLAARQARPHPP
jgi:low temperature requirement protein LtrA